MKITKDKRPDIHRRSLSIIVVDDERSILTVFARRLKGHDLRIATSIREAVLHLDCGFVPDVVIADWNLGDGTFGSGLLDIVKKRFPEARRVLISGSAEKIVAKGMNTGEEVLDKMSSGLEALFQELEIG